MKEVPSLSDLFSEEEENLKLFGESGSCANQSFSEFQKVPFTHGNTLRSWQGSCGSFTGDGLLDLNESYSGCSHSSNLCKGSILGTKASIDFAAKSTKSNFPMCEQLVAECKPNRSPRKRRQNVSKKAMENKLLGSVAEGTVRHRCDEVLFHECPKTENSPRKPRRTVQKDARPIDLLRQPVRKRSDSSLIVMEDGASDSQPAIPSRTHSPSRAKDRCSLPSVSLINASRDESTESVTSSPENSPYRRQDAPDVSRSFLRAGPPTPPLEGDDCDNGKMCGSLDGSETCRHVTMNTLSSRWKESNGLSKREKQRRDIAPKSPLRKPKASIDLPKHKNKPSIPMVDPLKTKTRKEKDTPPKSPSRTRDGLGALAFSTRDKSLDGLSRSLYGP